MQDMLQNKMQVETVNFRVSTVNVRLGSKLLNLAKTAEISEGLIKTRVSST